MNSIGTIKPTSITEEMKRSYLDYAMSVIVARAIPDVRDGLKPVHRRVLYALHKLGIGSSSSYKKSARIVGETIGKYHPHGDIAVYDTLVRLVQDFSLRYPLVDGQGNFGSIDGDSPAAMRYTEVRLSKIAQELLSDLDKKTVDFIDNFDGSEQEPVILPAKLPNLLLNGGDGIAVGMATKIPPHNLGEVINALVAIIENIRITEQKLAVRSEQLEKSHLPSPVSFKIDSGLTVADLLKYIPGPDFPTRGIIYGAKDILAAYETGRGGILVRGKAKICEAVKGKRLQIIITELPYQQNKALLVSKIASLVNEKKLTDVADLRDESDRQGLRIVVELKTNANPQKTLNRLYQYTPLSQKYHLNMVALVDGEPRTLNLKQALLEYLKHRQTVIIRRAVYQLNQARARAHVLKGYKIALDNLDAVIQTIRKAANQESAKEKLIQKFKLSEIQAQAILDLQLKRLTALDRKKILDELKAIKSLIADLESLLESPQKIMSAIKHELLELKEKYADQRRTQIVKGRPGEISEEDLVKNEKVIVTLSKAGYIKRLPIDTYRAQGRGGKGVTGAKLKEEDVISEFLTAMTHDQILFFTNKGRVFSTRVFDIPEASRTARGQAVVNLIGVDQNEKVASVLTLSEGENAKPKIPNPNDKQNPKSK